MDRQDGGLIIYTSGSTGTPRESVWSAAKPCGRLRRWPKRSARSPRTSIPCFCPTDAARTHLRRHDPGRVGGRVHYDGDVARNSGAGIAKQYRRGFRAARPTTSVLVPQLLGLYALQLMAAGKRPHEELRFVAVGGALSPRSWRKAPGCWASPSTGVRLFRTPLGASVYRPGACREGTAGKPLPGLKVAIEDGEIVVEGPTIMDGYLYADAPSHRWHTGDVGSLDADGYVTIYGRRDNLIITPYGRNLSPEWIETILLGDPRLRACILAQRGQSAELAVLLIPSPAGEAWFKAASQEEIVKHLGQALNAVPAYARPKHALVLGLEEAASKQSLHPEWPHPAKRSDEIFAGRHREAHR